MMRVKSEFDPGDRPPIELLRNSADDSQDQLRRARQRLERAERRVRNLEVAHESWNLLVAQYERAQEHGRERNGSERVRV